MAKIIDGKALAAKKQAALQEKVERLKAESGLVPGLVVILVGDDPASQVYVRNKERFAKKVGFLSETVRLSESISEEELIQVIEKYNKDERFHGILVQLPLPKHINDKRVILAIDPKKDVDGFHPMNTGHLWSGRPVMVPCTPAGIMELLREYEVALEGKTAVIIGRSNIVGKPMAQLLLEKNATVTLAHSRTRDLAKVTKQADILIVAIGQGHFVTADFVKEGAVVIDVGMNRDVDGRLIGDVDFEGVEPIASLITPVPGGVGPMTITMLMEQTYQSALRSVSL
ncbi:bifunctional methylenetetrahydrofolate dehydrogenase/methenyltetrahydrofolate cyclohydrolase [Streptococcus alactolyticus]|jgi:methylenetetrahydrofolate dehydrogenase (NADP+)/methenyltetrahydrofolate cyclohydrolase|uniref:Bifunctional protein FolD n=1 Tax=Streptococcus alactolyticus TaxID=29389 RepID=A0A6N7X417_STRAY|nr:MULTISPECIES: bifunctional methylenetetrahydrofolate dehydrogenase/methenyltetrahydrofolate cyclohydrolase [Streptococcus]MDE2586761.1 bifunctional methylenetetrahydrofolate dehydrogenase/methenyltetrahydrofolate cyclohydrolase [Lactobacillales bacterium]MCF2665584.1 bifunctional methylenetetrahydrofolate dehydrogenase/methenyltetrahydrofolate cyclohydrolase [Streptococcus alactolyticus]MCF2678234.1 bifunctional methylenetetrahydrofolate dehydrogenase/methenyltetrahydrofolate cyclohydrolase [